jgi:hypothetical protein
MKKLVMMLVVAAATMLPLAAYGRAVVLVAPGFGWGYSSYWGPYPYAYGYYGYAPVAGAIKLDTKVKDAAVYIDGAYAGTAGKLKTMYLRPGSYDVEVRSPGGGQFDQKLYVTAGKTLHVNPNLPQPQAKP